MRKLDSWEFKPKSREKWKPILDGSVYELKAGEDYPADWEPAQLIRNLRASGRSLGMSVDWDVTDNGVVVQARPIRRRTKKA